MKDAYFTYYAQAERSPMDEILRQHELVAHGTATVNFLDEVAPMVALLNANRQIVWANRSLLTAAGCASHNDVLGKRVGELFGCIHTFEVNGCGTSRSCGVCGAVRTMVQSLESPKVNRFTEDCCLQNRENTFDLRVTSSVVVIKGEKFIVCSIQDIADQKRRGVMERIFFHDILNSVNSIGGIAQALNHYAEGDTAEMASHLMHMVSSLTEEINAHKVLTQAENGEYERKFLPIQSMDTLRAEVLKYEHIARSEGKTIVIDPGAENCEVLTDRVLLARVLCNMIKNALEAEPAGATITAGTGMDSVGRITFYVHNESVIPPKVALQIFERSFSTKGKGRGLGTYSMKLLSEHYLGGKVGFTSADGEGTTFTLKIPSGK